MTKGQDSKKGTKKEPVKTLKEKRAAKKAKKDEKKNQGFPREWHDLQVRPLVRLIGPIYAATFPTVPNH